MNPHKLTNLRPLPVAQAMTAGELDVCFTAWRGGIRRVVNLVAQSIPQVDEKQTQKRKVS